MSEFTAPTGERAEKILQASREVIAAGQTIGSGAAELTLLKKASGLDDITPEERDWAFEQDQPKDAKDANLSEVHCAQCDRDIPADDVEEPTKEGKVYVTCHGARQGVPIPKSGPIVAFQ